MSPKNAGESDEITGQSALPSTSQTLFVVTWKSLTVIPVSRIKKIIQLDDDIVQCSNNSTFVIAMATVRCPSRELVYNR